MKITISVSQSNELPNVNSYGNPIHVSDAGVKNFWRWFGNSKLVDKQGRPLIIFHGTKADVKVFSLEHASPRTDHGWFGRGFYFTGSPDLAGAYATRNPDGSVSQAPANVMLVYVRAEKPFYIDLSNMSYEDGSTFTRKYGGPDGWRAWLSSHGYDAVIGTRDPNIAGKGAEHWEIVVFDPTQIKSVFNTGEFNRNNDAILSNVVRPS